MAKTLKELDASELEEYVEFEYGDTTAGLFRSYLQSGKNVKEAFMRAIKVSGIAQSVREARDIWRNTQIGAEYYMTSKNDTEKDDPCWDGYEMVGTKIEDGEEVPNCVPKEKAQKIYVGSEDEVPEDRQLKEDDDGKYYA